MKHGTAESYSVFVRDWWRKDERGNLVPYPGAPRRTLARNCTEEEAQAMCREYNESHNPGWRSRKAEYQSE